MSLQKIRKAFAAVQELTLKEKQALADFERRIYILYDHKKSSRKITNQLQKLKAPKSKAETQALQQSLLKEVNKLLAELHQAFYSFNLPESMKHLSEQDQAVIEREINENMREYEQLKSFNTIAAQKITRNLTSILVAEEKGKELLEEFRKRIVNFKNILKAQSDSITAEISTLNQMQAKITAGSITPTDIDSWQHCFKNHQMDIDRLLKAEKEVLHEPLDILLKKTHRAFRLAKRAQRREKITYGDIKRDIQTFSKPEEYNYYANSLIRSGMLDKKLVDFLSTGGLAAARAEEKKSFTISALKNLAFVDALTNLYNRHHLEKEVKNLIALVQTGTLRSFSLLMMDIDHFKPFNDNYSHEVGDIVLRNVATFIKATVRDSDIVARWGGEEFIVLLPGLDKQKAVELAQRIRKAVQNNSAKIMAAINKEYLSVKERRNFITVSIGVANYPTEEDNKDKLWALADRRLYKAKSAGRNRVAA